MKRYLSLLSTDRPNDRSSVISDYWLVSVPSRDVNVELLDDETEPFSDSYSFDIPDFKVGTLDQLVGAADELQMVDNFSRQLLFKLTKYVDDVVLKKLSICSFESIDIESYLMWFEWDSARYPTNLPIWNLTSVIKSQTQLIDDEFHVKCLSFDELKRETAKRSESYEAGSLMTRNLGKIVKKEDFVFSEYLTTLLVCVPRCRQVEWINSYETLTKMVVPRTSFLIAEDSEYSLFTVTLFRIVANEFEDKAMTRNFIVRHHDLDEAQNELKQLRRSSSDLERQIPSLIIWLKSNIVQTFKAWIHVKAMRVFVESVLRYGLPVAFKVTLMRPHDKCEQKLRLVLQQLFGHLDDHLEPGLSFAESPYGEEYYPYVYYRINVQKIFGS